MMRVVATCLAAGLSSVAYAQGAGTRIPEPGDAALFAIAVAALVIGRQASKRPPSQK
ncbi:MAG: hypothetical protein ABI898_03735 [Sphingomonadales bacterium]